MTITKYRIHWRAPETGATGHGKPIFKTHAMAQHTADALDTEGGGVLKHWVEPVEVEVEQEQE